MILPIYTALDRMDPAVIEAGKDLYGSGWQTFRHVTWPTTFTYMIGNLIQQQFFGAENWPFGAALTTLMMLFLMVWMIFYLRSAARAAREAVVA